MDASELMLPRRKRMPVSLEELKALLRPGPAERLKATRISRKVNNSQYTGEDVPERLRDDPFE